ncbi:hypothetical protein NMG60_11032150 [Bertholletia excelsa]
MRLFSLISSSLVLSAFLLLFPFSIGVEGTEFTLLNNCNHSIWPAILANPGSPNLEQTGFQLPARTSRTLRVPDRWAGKIWARNGCNFNKSGFAIEAFPVTLVEFTLGSGARASYDVSLIYGFNLPVIVEPLGGSGTCGSAGCTADLNLQCPAELRAAGGLACRSGCMAFGTTEYCGGSASEPRDTSKRSSYYVIFKSACPRSLITSYDDSKSTFTCEGANYKIRFCPSDAGPSQKYAAKKFTSAATVRTEEPGKRGSGTVYRGSKYEVKGSQSSPAPHW